MKSRFIFDLDGTLLQLDDSIQENYSGEIATKPHKGSYLMAKGDYDIQEYVMIGNNYLRDYVGALGVFMDAVL